MNEVLNDRAALLSGNGTFTFGFVRREFLPQPFDLLILTVEAFELVLDHLQDARAGLWIGRLQLQYLLDFIEREAETLRSLDEAHAIHHPPLIEPVAARCPGWFRQESELLIIAERINADPALRGDLANL